MSHAYREILEKSKELNSEEKENVALFLLHSLEKPDSNKRTEKQWQAEIIRRNQEFESGKETGIDWEDIKKRYH